MVRDPEKHRQVLESFGAFAREAGFEIHHVIRSPVSGADGNLEFLLHVTLVGKGLEEDAYRAACETVVEG